jgi:N-acetylneuraminate lyase
MINGLAGVIPAVVTPLEDDGALHVRSFERLLERMYQSRSSGVYVCGQTGEGLQLPPETRKKAAEVAIRNTPSGKQALIHIGAASTSEAADLARHASRFGAHAVSSLPPGSAYRFDEVKAYYQAIAAAADLPVLVYFFPDYSRSVSSIEQILELCSIPGVVGLKYTDFDLYRMSLVSLSGATIFNGRDEVFAAGLLMGAHGGIGSFYNLIPELFVETFEHAQAGKWAEARKTQDRINKLIQAVLRFPMLASIKHLLTISGIDCGNPKAPRRPLHEDEATRLGLAIKEAGWEFGPLELGASRSSSGTPGS